MTILREQNKWIMGKKRVQESYKNWEKPNKRNPTTFWIKNQKTKAKMKFLRSRIIVAEMIQMDLFLGCKEKASPTFDTKGEPRTELMATKKAWGLGNTINST